MYTTPINPVTDATSLIAKFAALSNAAVWVLVALAVVFIVWNAVQFIRHADAPDDRKTYQNAILWGIVGLAVILSIWGLVAILMNTFGTTNSRGQLPASNEVKAILLTK